MEIHKMSWEVEVYEHSQEMTQEAQHLLEQATLAAKNAYAPYSNFQVGAAVRLANGVIIQGANQENAAFPNGACAEQVALFYAGARYPEVAVEAIAITVGHIEPRLKEPISPCGKCRQVMCETQSRHEASMQVILRGHEGPIYVFDSATALLPLSFDDKILKGGS